MKAPGLRVFVEGVGLLGPGLPSWADSQATLRGEQPHVFQMTTLAPPARLPPAERRRSGPVIRLAMGVAEEAVMQAGADPQTLGTVFTSSGGEGANCHSLCETLASPNPLISPTRFTNSVHNAAAGYWHIAVASRAASTSLCAHDGSFGAGLIEAATLIRTNGLPLLLVAYDLPYPEPLNAKRPLVDNFGLSLLLTADATPRSLGRLDIALVGSLRPGELTSCGDESLDALRRGIPAAAALPLLQALARGARHAPSELVTHYLPTVGLAIGVDCNLAAA